MVLTNFECWAHGGGGGGGANLPPNRQADNIFDRRNRTDLFNPSVLQACGALQSNNNNVEDEEGETQHKAVSHISSNGYYGFSYVNQHQNRETNAAATGNDVNIVPTGCTAAAVESASEIDDGRMDVADGDDAAVVALVDYNVASSLHTNGNFPMGCGGGGCDRRKRFFNGEDFVAGNQLNAKRCRFDNDNDFGLMVNSHLIPMEAADATTPYHNNTMEQSHQPIIIKSNTEFKRTTNNNNDISRCMLSHMI